MFFVIFPIIKRQNCNFCLLLNFDIQYFLFFVPPLYFYINFDVPVFIAVANNELRRIDTRSVDT